MDNRGDSSQQPCLVGSRPHNFDAVIWSGEPKRFPQALFDWADRHEAAQLGLKRGLAFGRMAHLPCAIRSVDHRGGDALGLGRLLDIVLDGLGNDAELTLTMRPVRCLRMCGSTALIVRKRPNRLVSNSFWASTIDVSSIAPSRVTPLPGALMLNKKRHFGILDKRKQLSI